MLYADIWRPQRNGRFPVLLQRTAYDKSSSHSTMHLFGLEPVRAAERGYVVVVQDVRGRGVSAGRFEPFRTEAADGAEAIRWAATLPWSNGRVGMYGASYVGATQLLPATLAPPELFGIAPHVTSADYHDGWTYQSGAFQLGFALLWAAGSLATVELERRRAAGDNVDELAEQLEALLRDPTSSYQRLPLVDQPVLAELCPAYLEWLAHPSRDEYWQAISVADRHDQVRVPALHIGGWHDIFIGGTLRNFTGLQASAATQRARSHQRLIVGPWAHAVPYDAVGRVDYGPSAGQPALDMTDIHLAWFDSITRRREAPQDDAPPVRLFVMGANRWRDEDAWPPRRVRSVEWHLRREGRLTLEPPTEGEPPDGFVYDPHDPVPTSGGQTYLPGVFISLNAGQQDQSALGSRPDVLSYTSAALKHDSEVTGHISVVLYAATSAADTDWTAKLVEIAPSGRALNITDGILRARYRDGLAAPRLLSPGEICRYEIDLVATSIVLKAGHRLRVDISSSNFPRFDRNPNNGGDTATATEQDFVVARQTVFHDAAHPSRVQLQLI